MPPINLRFQFDNLINQYFMNMERRLRAFPLNLGGSYGSGGGAGGPPGGFIGVLPQTRVSYDLSELATSGTPASGFSLLDNLNHIRYRIETLEGTPSTMIVKQDDMIIASGISILDFHGAATVIDEGSGEVQILISGVSGSGIDYVTIQENDVIVGNATVLNFEGAVDVLDEGGGKITITVSGTTASGTDNDEKVKVSSNDTTTNYLENKVAAGTNISLATLSEGGDEQLEISVTGLTDNDEKTKVSSNDTTTDYLENKVAAGTNISLATLNEGGDEQLEISVTGITDNDEKTKVSSNDTVSDYLENKLVPGSGISLSILNEGGDEDIEISVSGLSTTDEKAKVSANDTSSDYLENKIVAGTNITIAVLGEGSDETLEITSTVSGGGSGINYIEVQEDDVPISNATILNFEGDSVGILDEGGGKATITISGVIGSGASNFLELTDTPATYSGYAYRFPRVNDTEDALEFSLADYTGVVIVDRGGKGHYTTIKEACDYVSTQTRSATNIWLIQVYPGKYYEQPFTVPTYTSITTLATEMIGNVGKVIVDFTNTLTSGDAITLSGGSNLFNLMIQFVDGTLTSNSFNLIRNPNGAEAKIGGCYIKLFAKTTGTVRCIYQTGTNTMYMKDTVLEYYNYQTGIDMTAHEKTGGTLWAGNCMYLGYLANHMAIDSYGFTQLLNSYVNYPSGIRRRTNTFNVGGTYYGYSIGTITHLDYIIPNTTAGLREAADSTVIVDTVKAATNQTSYLRRTLDNSNNVIHAVSQSGEFFMRTYEQADEPDITTNNFMVVWKDTDNSKMYLVARRDAGDQVKLEFDAVASGSGTDEKVKVSSNDTTANYLENKIVAGSGITITTLDDGSNETLQITSTASGAGSGEITVKDDDLVIASGVTILNFAENLSVTDDGGGQVTISGTGSVIGSGGSYIEIFNENIVGSGTDFNTIFNYAPNTLQVTWNGVRQSTSYFTENLDKDGFTTTFIVDIDDELLVDYIRQAGVVTSGNPYTIAVQDNDSTVSTDVTVLNFEGAVNVTDEGAGKTTVTVSGGTSGGADILEVQIFS